MEWTEAELPLPLPNKFNAIMADQFAKRHAPAEFFEIGLGLFRARELRLADDLQQGSAGAVQAHLPPLGD